MTTMTMEANLISDDAVRAATGRSRDEWFTALDERGSAAHPHRDIAAWLMTDNALDTWWAQTITVEYERARGLRPLGGGRDGLFSVSSTKTVAVPADQLFAAIEDAAAREAWLPDAYLRPRPSTAVRTARFDWAADGTRVVFAVVAKGGDRSTVAMQHERLPDAESARVMKAFWRERLSVLKSVLES
jgi:hypothetical protein